MLGAMIPKFLNWRRKANATNPKPESEPESEPELKPTETSMKPMSAGITKAGEGMEGIKWNILGQIYVPKQHCEDSFSWHATFPQGTFVPPHIHPTQDEFIYMLEGRLDLILDGEKTHAGPGDTIRLPRGIPHGLFNHSEAHAKCVFWVAPAQRLYDLFWALHNLGPEADPADVVAVSAQHEVDFLPPPDEA